MQSSGWLFEVVDGGVEMGMYGVVDRVDYWMVWSSGWLCGVVDGGME